MIPAEIISELKKIGRKQNHGFLYHSDPKRNKNIPKTKHREIPENGSVVDECVRVFNEAVDRFDDVVINGFYVYDNRQNITSFHVYGLTYQHGILYSQKKLI